MQMTFLSIKNMTFALTANLAKKVSFQPCVIKERHFNELQILMSHICLMF